LTDSSSSAAHVLRAASGDFDFAVMGILNVTPDSFSDGGAYEEPSAAIAHGRELIAEGARIIDVGGESTRPGAPPVSPAEELRRTQPVLEALGPEAAAAGVQISIDTSKAQVAAAALAAGASLVNDQAALRYAPEIAELVASSGADLCLMHMSGDPRTMQRDPHYDDVVAEVKRFLEQQLRFATDHGVPEERVLLDPGIGFGKTVEHNLALIARLDELLALGRPILIGTSRKSFIGRITGRDTSGRLAGTLASNILAYEHGARVFRVHEVAPLVDALKVTTATLRQAR
jgi:dihydropteroate synthase